MQALHKKWFIAMGLSSLIVLTACSDGATNVNQATNNGKSTEPATNVNAGSETEKGKFDPPIEVTSAKMMYNAAKFVDGQTNDKNVWTDLFEQELGIKLKYVWTTPEGTDYTTKANVAIASGDLPDFFQVNQTQLGQMVDSEQIADLTDIFEQYASPELKALMGETGNAMKMSTIDGKLMALPMPVASIDQSQMVWIRTDWLKALNLPEPKTIDDLLAISEAFTNNDPDGNGQKDTYGIALYKDFFTNNASATGFLNSHHAYFDQWLPDASGNLVYSSIQPEMKNALLALKELYKSGQIDKEFAVKDRTKAIQDISAGKNGINFATFSSPTTTYQAGYELNPAMDWKPFPLLSVDGEPARPQITADTNGYFVVSKSFQHPEALIMLANKAVERYNNLQENDPYFFSINNYHLYTDFGFFTSPTRNIIKYKAIQEAITSKDSSKLNVDQLTDYTFIMKFLNNEDPKQWYINKLYGEGGAFSVNEQYYENKLYSRNQFFGSPTKTMLDKGASLNTLQTTVFTKFVMGEDAPDEFEKFVSDWKKLGGDQITAEVNEWYAANKN